MTRLLYSAAHMKAFAKPRSRRVRFESFELDLDTASFERTAGAFDCRISPAVCSLF